MQELWRPVVGFENRYAVSDQGNVKRLAHTIEINGHPKAGYTHRTFEERTLKKILGANGYYTVTLGRGNPRLVHVLVLEAFVGPRPEGSVACHGPNGKLDNSLSNLCWGSHNKNTGEDRHRDGTIIQGERHPGSKLTNEAVLYIREHYKAYSYTALGRKFNVSRNTVRDVVQCRMWRHV